MPAITHTLSEQIVAKAIEHLPGGVNSPVRAFRAVGGSPVVFEKAEGAYLVDVDGNRYLDFIGSWGPMILGHAHPDVVSAVHQACTKGLSFGATSPYEVEMAKKIKEFFTHIELVRLVSSGTEATMSALRVARGFTNRPGIIKFEGCYHGHSDCLLAKAGSGAMTLALPDSAGIPPEVTQNTYTAPYNDLAALAELMQAKAGQIAAVIVEPVAGNMGTVAPKPGYLEGLRELCTQHGSVLIFDEVMTGFRLSRSGAQGLYGIQPDLTCLGKIVGGGLPMAAYGGRRDIMQQVAPLGPVYQAGTLSGNPVAVAAGLTTLQTIDKTPNLYDVLSANGQRIQQELTLEAKENNWPLQVQQVGSMITIFFSDSPVTDYASAKNCDTARYAKFFRKMLEAGYYLPPSQFEAMFLNFAQLESEIGGFIAKAKEALRQIFHESD